MPAAESRRWRMLDGPLTRAVLHDEMLSVVAGPLRPPAHRRVPRRGGGPAAGRQSAPDRGGGGRGACGAGRGHARAVPTRGGDHGGCPEPRRRTNGIDSSHGVFTYELPLRASRRRRRERATGASSTARCSPSSRRRTMGWATRVRARRARLSPAGQSPRPVDQSAAVARAPMLKSDGKGAMSLRIEDDLGRSVATINRESASVSIWRCRPIAGSSCSWRTGAKPNSAPEPASGRGSSRRAPWQRPRMPGARLGRAGRWTEAVRETLRPALRRFHGRPARADARPSDGDGFPQGAPRSRSASVGRLRIRWRAPVLATLTGVFPVAALGARQDFDEAPVDGTARKRSTDAVAPRAPGDRERDRHRRRRRPGPIFQAARGALSSNR